MHEIKDEQEMSGTWKFVAEGNDKALSRAMNGDPQGALIDLDQVRDEALKMEVNAPHARNEIECRRLEMRLWVAGVSDDWDDFCKCMQEIGQSQRFDADRLHHLFAVAGGHMRSMLSKGKT